MGGDLETSGTILQREEQLVTSGSASPKTIGNLCLYRGEVGETVAKRVAVSHNKQTTSWGIGYPNGPPVLR